MGTNPIGQKVYTPDTNQCNLIAWMHRRFLFLLAMLMAAFWSWHLYCDIHGMEFGSFLSVHAAVGELLSMHFGSFILQIRGDMSLSAIVTQEDISSTFQSQ